MCGVLLAVEAEKMHALFRSRSIVGIKKNLLKAPDAPLRLAIYKILHGFLEMAWLQTNALKIDHEETSAMCLPWGCLT